MTVFAGIAALDDGNMCRLLLRSARGLDAVDLEEANESDRAGEAGGDLLVLRRSPSYFAAHCTRAMVELSGLSASLRLLICCEVALRGCGPTEARRLRPTIATRRTRTGMSALQGKVALVTGASSGLGAETARLFSRQGATVFGIGRDTGTLGRGIRRRGTWFIRIGGRCFGAGLPGRGRAVRPRVRRSGRPRQHRRATPDAPNRVDDRRRLDARPSGQPERAVPSVQGRTAPSAGSEAATSSTSAPLPASKARPTRPATALPSTA